MKPGTERGRTTDDELRHDVHAMISVIWWAVGLTLGAGLSAYAMGWIRFDLWRVSGLAVAIVVSSLISVWCVAHTRKPLTIYFAAHLCNVVMVTIIIHSVGGIAFTPAPLFYSLIIVNAGIVGAGPAYVLALASTAAYASLGALELASVLVPFPPLDAGQSEQLRTRAGRSIGDSDPPPRLRELVTSNVTIRVFVPHVLRNRRDTIDGYAPHPWKNERSPT